jgi:hypothetical protein
LDDGTRSRGNVCIVGIETEEKKRPDISAKVRGNASQLLAKCTDEQGGGRRSTAMRGKGPTQEGLGILLAPRPSVRVGMRRRCR